VNFPLGYPLLLGLVKLVFFTEVITAAPILNSLLLSAVLYTCSYLLLQARIKHGFFRLLILCLILSSPGIVEVYTMLWSETVFILLVLIFIAAFHLYLSTEKISWLLFASIIAALACSVRYVGITLLITGGILILFSIELENQI
jgi:dolichyl-phosphate-mannose--protein O-mannosyl transferase